MSSITPHHGDVPQRETGRSGQFIERHWSPQQDTGRRRRSAPYRAFIPDPIAELEPTFSSDAVAAIAAAEAEIRHLNTARTDLLPLEGIARQLLRSEALASSAIEGLQLSQRRLARAAIQPAYDPKAQEVLANITAVEQAGAMAASPSPFTLPDLQAIHTTIALGNRYLRKYAGQVRQEPGWIGGTSPVAAEYVPPPFEYLPVLLDDLVAFMNERDDLPAIVQAGIAHAQFEAIHPFGDGNGRTGRCLIHAILTRRGLTPHYVPPISVALASRRYEYVAGLTGFQRGQIDTWSSFFADTAFTASRRAEVFTQSVSTLQRNWRDQIQARSDSTVWAMIDALASYPVIDARTAGTVTGRSFNAANNALDQLEQIGALKRRDNRVRGRSWEAKQLLDLLDAFETSLAITEAAEDDFDDR